MQHLLQYFVLLPLAACLFTALAPRRNERLLSGIALISSGLHLLGVAVFTAAWLAQGQPTLDFKALTLYRSPHFEFFIDFYFDRTTAVFALVGSLLALLVSIFSRFYMHREDGFKRFFAALTLFFMGYNFVVFAGNFETLFLGWEVLGITSFLLIAFYRDRYLPVRNAYKVLSFYRLGDICLMLAMWMSHHLWHKNITFSEWAQLAPTHEGTAAALFIALMTVLAAAIKSAQAPFSTWLPRAMEGPTTSSAIFYGSLSVHIGAFLLLRTYPFWENEPLIKGAVIAIGLVSSLLANSVARVQSSVKTQIAYSSIAQIGLMFVEIALGWHAMALAHFTGNALLRTYQLLVSPSVLSYLVHDMFFSFAPRAQAPDASLLGRLRAAAYILAVKEWNFDHWLRRFLWQPFKWVGSQIAVFSLKMSVPVLPLAIATGIPSVFLKESFSPDAPPMLAVAFAAVALLGVLKSLAHRGDARMAWGWAIGGQLCMAIAIFLNSAHIEPSEIACYLSGIVVAAAVGMVCLQKINALETAIALGHYHGHSYEHRGLALVFLVSSLAFAGFPISPTFVGVDLMFTHIGAGQWALISLVGLNFLFLELALLRIYARVFLGQHSKAYHPIAFKSS